MRDLGLFLAIALAGGFGAGLRYLVDHACPARATYPWGTTVVNVSGSFALGLLVGVATPTDTWTVIVGTGLLGGYTTFSTASLDTTQLLADRRWAAAVGNSVGMLVGCVLAALAGYALTQA